MSQQLPLNMLKKQTKADTSGVVLAFIHYFFSIIAQPLSFENTMVHLDAQYFLLVYTTQVKSTFHAH